ncbi:hypothetical protein SAMN02745208_02840 [Heyndrickxia coagulans DSM 1 = ATCC 7050]|uniref:Uncharacterized protein n=1 Tax=Heyndrickxia coagulans DSM 1 = ATCC 7050 TaxID=1121088 RepID=A0A8B4BY34_HEYCO|nr:hypothetical protein SAMN02745208_02840 [Heyndrickxia coagulans DSM 1 = ATCC 7050]
MATLNREPLFLLTVPWLIMLSAADCRDMAMEGKISFLLHRVYRFLLSAADCRDMAMEGKISFLLHRVYSFGFEKYGMRSKLNFTYWCPKY